MYYYSSYVMYLFINIKLVPLIIANITVSI